ncbi:MAG: S46 family peptidase [Bacteroidales bacterium]|nr:S46 family peptidase [Bacteroidales bacterium]
MRKRFISILFLLSTLNLFAIEGMWIPLLVEQQIFPAMQEAGCKMTPEQIYSAKQACLTNAIVRIGRGCTGSFISNEGLVLTNFHCVQHQISMADENGTGYFLEKGFFAETKDHEILTNRLSVESMEAMFDVTALVTEMKAKGLSMKKIADSLTVDSTKEFQYSIEEFYGGNQFFMFKTKKYTDVKLVAFMPAEIAQFGNNADNWSWPRNNADFALLRVYEKGEPVQPRKFLEINKEGVKEGDFSMVVGFPAETKMYGTQKELEQITEVLNPAQIKMRMMRLQPITAYMEKGDKEYQECYALYSSLSNYYEKWQAENKGVKTSGALDFRKEREENLRKWISSSNSLSKLYGNLLESYDSAATAYYSSYTQLVLCLEGLWRLRTMLPSSIAVSSPNLDFIRSQKFLGIMNKYNPELEKDAFVNLIFLFETYQQEKNENNVLIWDLKKVRHEDPVVADFMSSVFDKSVFTDYARAEKFQKMITSKKKYKDDAAVRAYLQKKDALYGFTVSVWNRLQELMAEYNAVNTKFDSVKCVMNKALYTYYNGNMFPDANNTMRISFGNVKSYSTTENNPYYTTEERVFKKLQENPREFKSNEKFLELLKKKDFGTFEKDSLIMNFITTCQTSGGNSGSPVIDANGKLIGLNFDRNREGTVSDFYYTESVCRNICVDIRYILFCLEQYGKADNIIQELSLEK